ncbi:MAG: lipopolysaccharide biosynthesis protein [Nitrospira sp.]|nr:MAG: lipopolysaccharide biosynthesis protein [Nitrospira sp.]
MMQPIVSDSTSTSESSSTTVVGSSLDRVLVRGLAWTGAVKWLSQLLSWVSTIVVARLLNPEDYGIVAMAGVFIGLIGLLNEFGLGAAVVALRHLTKTQIAQIHSLASLFGISGFLLTCAVAIPTGKFFGAQEVPLIMITMGAGFVILSMRSVPSALLEKDLRFKFLAFLEGGQSLVATFTTLIVAWLGGGYWALVLGGLAGQLAATTVIWLSRPLSYAWPTVDSMKETIRLSSHVLTSRVSWYVAASSDVFIGGRVLGQVAVGVYSMVGTLAYMPIEKITALLSRVMPAIYSTVQNDPQAMRRYLLLLTEALSLIVWPIAMGMSLVAHEFVLVVLGDKWNGVIAPLEILACWAGVRSVFSLVPPLLYVTSNSRVAMLNGLLCVATYPIAFWVGSSWGVVGLAWAWVVVQPFGFIQPYVHVLRAIELSFWRYIHALWPACTGVVFMVAAIKGIQQIVQSDWPLTVRLGVEICVGAVAYICAVLMFHHRRLWQLLAVVRSKGSK